MASNGTTPSPTSDALAVFPAIVECFTIILLGYITGRAGWITSTQAKGINTYTSMFALPALLFSNMATLDWSQVEWLFIAAIFISKTLLFVVVLLLSFVIQRPANIGIAALMAIFVTQSNDFALGYPIVQAIYGETNPKFIQYIYLLAPISLVILNPIGFVMLELYNASSHNAQSSKLRLLLRALLQIVTNPIIVSTILGLIANFLFHHVLPDILKTLLDTLSNSFSGPALFIIGLSTVGKFNEAMATSLLGSSLLVFAKLLAFPMIALGVTRALKCGEDTGDEADYAMFAFLYGTIPTAPTVFIYATRYVLAVDLVATSLVLATVVSAPLMFVSATLVSLQMFQFSPDLIEDASLDISVIALIFTVAVLLLFTLTRSVLRLPHTMIMILSAFQCLLSVGMILASTGQCGHGVVRWTDYVTYTLHTLGSFGVSNMTTVTALILYIISCRNLCRAIELRKWLLLYGIGSTVIMVGISFLLDPLTAGWYHTTSLFAYNQTAFICCVQLLNILATVFILVLRHRHMPHEPALARSSTSSSLEASLQEENSTNISPLSLRSYGGVDNPNAELMKESDSKTALVEADEVKPLVVNIEDIVPSPSSSAASETSCLLNNSCIEGRAQRCEAIKNYESTNSSAEDIADHQLGYTLVLLIVLISCQILVAFYYICSLIIADMTFTGIFVEIEFMYLVAHSGQGFFTFLIFGLGSGVVLAPIKRLIRKIADKVRGSTGSEEQKLSEETAHICQQFRQHHLQHCVDTLKRVHRSKLDCFHGAALSSWLIEAGLAADATEAQLYAEHLLQGEIIKSRSSRTNGFFYDTKRHIYQFSTL